DAAVSLSVQHAVQDMVQPQIDRLMEQVAMLAGSAQSDLREVERLTERWEVRAEGRFAGIESRLSMLADAAARTEEREKDLNQKVAGVAEDLIRRGLAQGDQ
ncbi:rhp6, partial [Symbiodinium pilosum]